MSDLFHEVSQTTSSRASSRRMVRADWHMFQILTKRPNAALELATSFRGPRMSGWASRSRTTAGSRPGRSLAPVSPAKTGSSAPSRSSARFDGPRPDGHRLADRRRRVGPAASARRSRSGSATCATAARRTAAFFFKQWGGRTPKSRRPAARRPDLGRDAGSAGVDHSSGNISVWPCSSVAVAFCQNSRPRSCLLKSSITYSSVPLPFRTGTHLTPSRR